MTLDLRATQLLGEEDVMVSGNLLVDHKQDTTGAWKMEKVESKDIEGKTIPFKEALDGFARSAKSICAHFSDTPKLRQ